MAERRKGIKNSILIEYQNTLNCSLQLRKVLKPYITKEYSCRQTVRILFVEWPPECNRTFSVDAEVFYNRRRKKENINEKNLIESDIREQLKNFYETNYISCYFPARPMNHGFCEAVKTIWNESAESERNILTKKGLKEIDLNVSAKLLNYVIKKAKPNMIFIFGATLDNLIKYADENLWENIHKNTSSFVLPYSYFEIYFASQKESDFSYVTLLYRYFQKNKKAIGEFQYDCCCLALKACVENLNNMVDLMEPGYAEKSIEKFLEGKEWKNQKKNEMLKFFDKQKNDFQKNFLKNIRQQITHLNECFTNLRNSVDVIIKANDIRIPTQETKKNMSKARKGKKINCEPTELTVAARTGHFEQ